MPAQVSMRDVARKLGVSAMTVSRALSNSPKVSLETQKWVAREAEQMGYRSNPYLRVWMADRKRRSGTTQQVSLALLNFWTPPSLMEARLHCRQIQQGCIDRARALGYEIDVLCPKASKLSDARLQKVLQSRGIRGLLIPPLPASHAHLRLDCSRYAAVAMGFTLRYPNLNRVTLNPSGAMELVIRQTKRAGYRRIGLVVTKTSASRLNHHHVATFLLYRETTGATAPILWVSRITPAEEVRKWVKKHRLEAVIAENEGVYTLMAKAGFRFPDDIGLVAFSRYDEACKELGVDLTGVDLGNNLVGAHAVDMVANQVERLEYGVPTLPMTLMVPPRWHPGGTLVPQR